MHDPAVRAHVRLADQPERLVVRVAAVDEHRLADPARQRELASERALLGFTRREVAKEIEASLADRDDARTAGQPLDLGERRLVGLGGFVRMNPDRRPHIGLARGQCRRGARGAHIGSNREDAPDTGSPRALEDGVEVAGELGEVQVRVGVEEIRSAHTAPRTPAAFFTSRAFTHRIAA
jgi:hypothetical protein